MKLFLNLTSLLLLLSGGSIVLESLYRFFIIKCLTVSQCLNEVFVGVTLIVISFLVEKLNKTV